MGFGSKLFGGSKSSPATVWGPQADFLKTLYGDAQAVAGAQMGQIGGVAHPLSQGLLGQGQQFLGGLGGGAGQQLNPFMGPGFAEQQIGSLQSLLNRNLEQNLTGLSSNAIHLGGTSNARLGLAQGQAIGDTQLALQAGASDIMQNDLMRQQQAAQAQAGLQAQSGLGGLSQLQGLFNLGMSPYGAEFGPLQALSGILGQPTVLGGGSSSQRGITQGMNDLGLTWGGSGFFGG